MRADIANRGGREQRQIVRNDDFTTLSNQGYLEESSIQKSEIEPKLPENGQNCGRAATPRVENP